MKKYGDDADSFHDQGTRVEASKKWHEQQQIRPKYSYRSSTKPKSNYKPKSTYKPNSKTYYKPKSTSKYVHSRGLTSYNGIVSCTKCGKLYNKNIDGCPYCKRGISHKNPNKRLYKQGHDIKQNEMFIKCPECGKIYNKNRNRCPHCHILKPSKPKQNNFKIVVCPKCGRKKVKDEPCSYCNYVVVCPKCGKQYNKKYKGEWVTSCPHCGISNIIKCRKCGNEYNKIQYDLCPYCKASQSNDKAILALCIALLIIFIIIMMLLL